MLRIKRQQTPKPEGTRIEIYRLSPKVLRYDLTKFWYLDIIVLEGGRGKAVMFKDNLNMDFRGARNDLENRRRR